MLIAAPASCISSALERVVSLSINPATGLSTTIHQLLRAEVEQFPEVKSAFLFGSRARGDYSPQSDIDIAIDAPTMTSSTFAQLWGAIDALPIAFPLDCVWLQAIPDSPLKQMIERDSLPL
jgi:predicted nucleotidyltransferase